MLGKDRSFAKALKLSSQRCVTLGRANSTSQAAGLGRLERWVATALILALMPTAASAQVAVQQPVVGVQGVRTSVSVPDRGSALLGGVSRAASSRSQYGLPPHGSNVGLERSASSQRVSVFIHDFDEMDRAVLGQAAAADRSRRASETNSLSDSGADQRDPRLAARRERVRGTKTLRLTDDKTSGLDNAQRDAVGLAAVGRAGLLAGSLAASNTAAVAEPSDLDRLSGEAEGAVVQPEIRDAGRVQARERSKALARAAEARGRWTLARLHWQAAERAGSEEARSRLAELAAEQPGTGLPTQPVADRPARD